MVQEWSAAKGKNRQWMQHKESMQGTVNQINVMKKLLGNYSYCQQRNPPYVYLVAVLEFFFFDTFALSFSYSSTNQKQLIHKGIACAVTC